MNIYYSTECPTSGTVSHSHVKDEVPPLRSRRSLFHYQPSRFWPPEHNIRPSPLVQYAPVPGGLDNGETATIRYCFLYTWLCIIHARSLHTQADHVYTSCRI